MYRLFITLDVTLGGFGFEWKLPGSDAVVAGGRLLSNSMDLFRWYALDWQFQKHGQTESDRRSAAASSVYALLKRIRLRLPLAPNGVNIGFRMESPLRGLAAGVRHEVRLPDDQEWFSWLARMVIAFAKRVESMPPEPDATPQMRGKAALKSIIENRLASSPAIDAGTVTERIWKLRATLECAADFIGCEWAAANDNATQATGRLTCSGLDELTWELTMAGAKEIRRSRHHLNSVRSQLEGWRLRFAANRDSIRLRCR